MKPGMLFLQRRIAQQRLQTAQFHEKRQQETSARIYYVLVAREHPDSEAAVEAQEWLAKNPLADNARTRFLRGIVAEEP